MATKAKRNGKRLQPTSLRHAPAPALARGHRRMSGRTLAGQQPANDDSAAQNDEILSAGMDIGRLEAMEFFLTVGSSAQAAIFENVKKSKAWRLLKNPRSSDGQNFSSLDEFCQVKLGKSYKRLQEQSLNLRNLGAAAFEQAERLGLRQVDHNAIKALPAPEREMVKQAIETAATKDEVLRTLEELATRFGQQHEQLTAALEEERAERRAQEEVAAEKGKRIDALKRQIKRIQTAPPDEELADLKREASAIANDAQGLVMGGLRQAVMSLQTHAVNQAVTGAHDVFLAGLLGQLQAALTQLRHEFSLPDVSTAADDPEWAKGA